MTKRIRMTCTFQENALSDQQILATEKATKDLYAKHFGYDYKLTTVWISIPSGQAYLGGEPSTASAVMLPVKDNLDINLRHAFMKDFCSMWMSITHCTKHQIIFNAPDFSYAEQMNNAMLQRIAPTSKPFTIGKIVSRLARSNFSKSYLSMPINL